MPVDYKNGKIYRLICSETGNQYIGSTTQPLCKRLYGHKNRGNTCVSKCFVNPKIILIKNVECETKEQLLMMERHYIETMECVNKYIPARTCNKFYCDCGGQFTYGSKFQHFKTKKHQNYLELENN